ncbi:MAG: hypothetical protein EA409_04240 [Saprospirales bacterium]|nr:MAG: hypothetical protein EA409_04240 [Saprospirales bacterium]
MKKCSVWIAILILMAACKTEETDSSAGLPGFVLEDIDKRVEQFRERKTRECEEKALRMALERVDSTLLTMELLIPIDTAVIQRPDRPKRPEIKRSQDTTAVAPFFQSAKTDSM